MSRYGSLRNSIAVCAALMSCGGMASAQQADAERSFTYGCDSLAIDLKSNRSVCTAVAISDGEITITADEGTTNETSFESSEWHFSGNVSIELDSAALTADTAVFRFQSNELVFGTLTGEPVRIEDFIEEQNAAVVGTAERISYDNRTGTAQLAGEATLALGQNEYRGCDLIYNLTAKTFNSGSSDCGVTVRLFPSQEDDPARSDSSADP